MKMDGLEDESFPFEIGPICRCELAVSFRGGVHHEHILDGGLKNFIPLPGS